jgi:hypothetical protein
VTALAIAKCGARLRIGAQVEARLAHLVPFALLGDDFAVQQTGDDVDRVGHAVALRLRVDAKHHRVRRQKPGAEAEHRPAARLVVELHDAVRHHKGMVVRQ